LKGHKKNLFFLSFSLAINKNRERERGEEEKGERYTCENGRPKGFPKILLNLI
jgi:hypothetical protein